MCFSSSPAAICFSYCCYGDKITLETCPSKEIHHSEHHARIHFCRGDFTTVCTDVKTWGACKYCWDAQTCRTNDQTDRETNPEEKNDKLWWAWMSWQTWHGAVCFCFACCHVQNYCFPPGSHVETLLSLMMTDDGCFVWIYGGFTFCRDRQTKLMSQTGNCNVAAKARNMKYWCIEMLCLNPEL